MGAAIAPGSQKWVGTRADFDSAPASTSSIATIRPGPASAQMSEAMIPEMRRVPVELANISRPTSIASPPAVVEIRAFIAARREDCLSW